jgi:hypothetical protein
MGHEGPHLQLRPLGGGREWDADPACVRPVGPAELLSARVAEANARRRTGLGLGFGDIRGAPHTSRAAASKTEPDYVVTDNDGQAFDPPFGEHVEPRHGGWR